MKEEFCYLDHAAATPLDPKVLAAMQPFFSDSFYNPSAPYAPAIAVRQAYNAAKQTIARSIGGKADELVMTAGATESINLAFSAVPMDAHVVTAAIEHHAVLAAARLHPCTLVESDERGVVSAQAIRHALQPNTQLVSIALANNELGTVQPLREVAAVLKAERERRLAAGDHTPLWLHTDASQGVGQLDVHVARLGVDMLTANAAKIYGPKQVGLLWASTGVALTPQVVGGGQERGLRSGTENVPGVIGFAKAMELATSHHGAQSKRLEQLRDTMQATLVAAFPQAVVSGHPRQRLSGHLHISFPGVDAERVLFALESRGVLVATGSACAANKGTRSHVLTAIKLSPQVADGSLRLSFGNLSTPNNTAYAAQCIVQEVQKEYTRKGHQL